MNMKPQDSASIVIETLQLPPPITSYLENNKDEFNDEVIGGILQDARHAWLSSGSKFTVFDISSGQKIAAWTFGATLRDFKARVTCVYELPTPLIEQTMQLLIGLECELIGGMVCLFHCNGSRILRAIQVDCQVVCLDYIEDLTGTALQCFDGAVLIGTHGGAAFIFDLNRQECTEAILNSMTEYDANIKDELNIANLVVLSIDNIDILSDQRAIARKKDHHIAIQINEGCIHNLQFILHNPDNSIKYNAERENIFVTNALYVPQLASIVIGFNIGAFQLWNLLSLQLEFTSPINIDGLPVTHIGFLEPCDDPRAFCYLWIIHSTLDKHDEGFPLATMYSLTYQEKKHLNDQNYSYHTFLTCNLRFNVELSNADGFSTIGKQLIGGRSLVCRTLCKVANKEDADEYVLNLCQIVWECWTVSAIAPVQSMMLLFDIDQWYKEHMPETCVLQTNNYMSVVNLGDTIAHTANSYLCDVKINSDTLSTYVSVQRLEEHFYPNAIGYECYCLTNTVVTKLLTMGVQRQLLASINEIGPSILLHPTKLFHQCMCTGLIPLYVDPQPSSNTSQLIQRQILLSIALEARLIQFLGKCACDWATGSHTSMGCTLQFLLDWSWNRALSLKQNGDQITVPLFNLTSTTPDRNSVQHLDNCVRQLGHIGTLYNIVIDKCSSYIMPESVTEIRQRQKIIQIVSQYFQVIQWFLNVGLLPEFRVDQMLESTDDRLPYPIESLVKFYQNRRLKLHCLNGENPANEDLQNKSSKQLFIDEFIKMECSEKKLKALWLEDDSSINGLYPPPSLHSLLKVYLIPEIKEEHKHSLILYVLVDYAMMFDDERYEGVIKRLMQFPTMFGLSNTAIKITQAFWHLDHRYFQLALNQLQCVLAGGCLSQWQHNVVLSALLVQKKTQSALQYLHVRKPCISTLHAKENDHFSNVYDDWDACSNLYLSRGLVYEAFNLNKDSIKNFSPDVQEERLKTFFEGCRKMGLLSRVILLPLCQFEENLFVRFLKSLDDPYSSDILVLYYLHRSRFIEAQQVNEELKRLTSKGQLPYDVTNSFSARKEHVHKTETRDQLVDLYCKTLPPITRQLAQYASANVLGRKYVLPTPMTVNVQINKSKPACYKSSLLQATIDKASETWLQKPGVAKGLKRTFKIEETPFLCTPKISKTSSRLDFVEKMSTTPEETPSKRLKLIDGASDQTKTSFIDYESVSPKLKKEMETLLHTPLVERKPKWRNSSSYSGRYSTDNASTLREATPQSILKVRSLRERLVSSPIDEKHLAETDDEIETGSQYTQSDNLSRSIRFNIPSRNNTPSRHNTPSPSSEYTSDLHDSYTELCAQNLRSHNYIKPHAISVSPRKSIHQSQDLSHSQNYTNLSTISERESSATEISPSVNENSAIIESECIEINEPNNVSLKSTTAKSEEIENNSVYIPPNIVCKGPTPRRSLRLSKTPIKSIIETRKYSLSTDDSARKKKSSQILEIEARSFLNQSSKSFIRRSLENNSELIQTSLTDTSVTSTVLNKFTTNTSFSHSTTKMNETDSNKTCVSITLDNYFNSISQNSSLRQSNYSILGSDESEENISDISDCKIPLSNDFKEKTTHDICDESLNSEVIVDNKSDVEANAKETKDRDDNVQEKIIRLDVDVTCDQESSSNLVIDTEADIIEDEKEKSTQENDTKIAVDSLHVQKNKLNLNVDTETGIDDSEEKYVQDESKNNIENLQQSKHFESQSNIDIDMKEKKISKGNIENDPSVILTDTAAHIMSPGHSDGEQLLYSEESEISSDAHSVEYIVESEAEGSMQLVIDDDDHSKQSESADADVDLKIDSENDHADEQSALYDRDDESENAADIAYVESIPETISSSSNTSNETDHLIFSPKTICVDQDQAMEINEQNISAKNDTQNINIVEEISAHSVSENINTEEVIETITNESVNVILKLDKSSESIDCISTSQNLNTEDFKKENNSDITRLIDSSANISVKSSENNSKINHSTLKTESSLTTPVKIIDSSSTACQESRSATVEEHISFKLVEKDDNLNTVSSSTPENASKNLKTDECTIVKSADEEITHSVLENNNKSSNTSINTSINNKIEEPVPAESSDKDLISKKSNESSKTPENTSNNITTEICSNIKSPKKEISLIADEKIAEFTSTPKKSSRISKINKLSSVKLVDKEMTQTAFEINSKTISSPQKLPEEVLKNEDSTVKLEEKESSLTTPIKENTRRSTRKRLSSLPVEHGLSASKNTSDLLSVSTNESLKSDTSETSFRSSRKTKSDVGLRSRQSISNKESLNLTSSNDDESKISTSRRSTRNSSAGFTSFTSQASIDSDQESNTSSRRKSRRSILVSNKPNLSVIPEVSHAEDDLSNLDKTNLSTSQNMSNLIDQYSSSRRLTRHQRSLLEKSLENLRSTSKTIIEEEKSEIIEDDANFDDSNDDGSSHCSSFTGRTMDPILLLDKPNFEGPPDLEEQAIIETNLNSSKASVYSDIMESELGKSKRASSEPVSGISKKSTKSLIGSPVRSKTPVRVFDTSIDTLNDSITDSPSSKPRRQSFNRAVEALSTPRRKRRLSVDSRKSIGETSSFENVGPSTAQEYHPAEEKETVDETSPVKKPHHISKGKSSDETSLALPVKYFLDGDEGTSQVPKLTIKRTRKTKAASLHGHATVSNVEIDDSSPIPNRARKSLILTPLSKEDRMSLSTNKESGYRRKTGLHKVFQPLQFVLKKK